MSVFQALKGTFTAGIKSITSSGKDKGPKSNSIRNKININVGGDLLHSYQCEWQDLQHNAEINATKAQEVDTVISALHNHYNKENEGLKKLHEEAADLPVLVTKLQELTDVLAGLEDEFDRVEASLVQLECVCEDADLARAKVIDAQNLLRYKQKRLADLEKMKVHLAENHAKKMKDEDKKRHEKLRERQEAFNEAFESDVDFFKKHGHLDTISTSSTESGKRTDLAEIEIEADRQNLDEFLASGPTDDIPEQIEDAMKDEEVEEGEDPGEGLDEVEENVDSDSERSHTDVTSPEHNAKGDNIEVSKDSASEGEHKEEEDATENPSKPET